jgi:aerobic-type carbon monoxide dehydrogenase small subunit (CoxS/CutS family)
MSKAKRRKDVPGKTAGTGEARERGDRSVSDQEIPEAASGGRGMISRRTLIKSVIAAGASVSAASYLFRSSGTVPGPQASAQGSVERLVTLTVNGQQRHVDVTKQETLIVTLRNKLGLTGAKIGCERGECGACTVLIDGQAVNACLVPFGQVRGRSVKTVEGLRGRHPLQQAFVTEGGTQCGICTPGMIMAAAALPRDATREDVRVGLAGNICRCTGYEGIYRAVKKASASARSNSARATARPRRSAEREGGQGSGLKAQARTRSRKAGK